MKRTTIKDLAKLLNLSTSTVSRALSDHPDISEATKNKVREAAATFNYYPNLHARHFRKQNSGLITLILPEINMFFSPSLLEGINKVIAATNFSMVTFLTVDSHVKEKEIIEQALSWAVEGVLLSLARDTHDLEHLSPLQMAGIPCVLLDKVLQNDQFPVVAIDSREASFRAVNHLIGKGHRNILGIFGDPNFLITKDRVIGYQEAMKKNGIPIREEYMLSVPKSEDLDLLLPRVLRYHQELTAIFTMSDELLAKSLFHLRACGLSIPGDLSVISISDGIFPYLTYPQITHIENSGSSLGASACQLLLGLIEKSLRQPDSFLSTDLVELESVGIVNS